MSGIVLAGGRSRRMGRDKAALVWEGQRLVDRAVATLTAACDDVVVAAGERRIDGLAVPSVPDQPRGIGPLGGLAGGLAAVDREIAWVLAVDMPTPDVELFRRLAAHWAGEPAIIPSAGGSPQPLHAVWSTDAAPAVTVLARAGVRSVVDAAVQLGARVLDDVETAALVDHDRWAWNVNRPSDLQPRCP